MRFLLSTFQTRFGAFSVACDEAGAVVATAFGGPRRLRVRLPRELEGARLELDSAATATAREQVLAYAEGSLHRFDLRLRPSGSAFQRRVWAELQQIEWGRTASYGELARLLGTAPRAIGRANATNPLCLIVPCHRVIGSDGSLTGFAFGERIKRALLEHERGGRAPD